MNHMEDDVQQRVHWLPDADTISMDKLQVWRTCPVTIAAGAMLDDEELDKLAQWLTPSTKFMQSMEFSRLVRQHVATPPSDACGTDGDITSAECDTTTAERDTASGDTASGDTASGDTASGDTASGDTASGDGGQMPRAGKTDPRARLWSGVHRIAFHAWADGRFIAMVDFGEPPASDPKGFHIRYADSNFVMGSGNPDNRHSVLPDTMLAAAAGSPMTGLLPHPMFDGLQWDDDQDPGIQPPMFGNGPGTPKPAHFLKGPPVDIPLGDSPGARFARLARERRPALLRAGLPAEISQGE